MRENHDHRWSVILAGGEGVRLRPLIRLIYGDERPKQFCRLIDETSLLTRTKLRIEKHIAPDRTLFVVTRSHEPFYRIDLADVAPTRIVIQPCNRGTLPAILWSLIRIVRLDPSAVVTFFPSDHHYSDEENFMTGVQMAYQAAEDGSSAVTLLGVPARHAEPGLGWIEAKAATSGASRYPLLPVKCFWEKPPLSNAKRLLERGCVWNTFVMVGRAEVFLEMIASAVPRLRHSFDAIKAEACEQTIESLYRTIDVSDFSAKVLAVSTQRLAVLCLGDVGWSDLGDPQRVIDALYRNGLEKPWLKLWRRQACSQTGPMHFGPRHRRVS